ncbi:MAG: hypothetical protein D3917_13665 [Candidatus Electrothrix sp. AX5]|nr:hypothetical protein [Candidatus Electrothrix sp. AX5]
MNTEQYRIYELTLYIKILFFILALLLSGCSSTKVTTNAIIKDIPKPALTNMSSSLDCMMGKINRFVKSGDRSLPRVLIIVDPFIDGTVRAGSATDGPLLDSGQQDFQSVLVRYAPDLVVVPYFEPLNNSMVEKTGIPKKEWVDNVKKKYGVDSIVRVQGTFNKFEEGHAVQRSNGADVSNSGPDIATDASLGTSSNRRTIGLIVSMVNLESNRIITSTDLEVTTVDEDTSVAFSIDKSTGVSVGLNYDSISIEGTHSAQRTLIEAAVFWLYGAIYSDIDYRLCLYDGAKSPAKVTSTLSSFKRNLLISNVAEIQGILSKYGYLDSDSYYAGIYGQSTADAMAEFLMDPTINNYAMPPQTSKDNLEMLYLLLKQAIPKLEERANAPK